MTAFQRQIEVAKKYDLPVNVHSRYAGHYCIDLLIQQGVKKALLHAYDGSKKSVKKGLAAGFYFSIPAAVKESTTFQRLAQTVPLEKMLLETDSPALGLEGKPNSVLNCRICASELQKLCEYDEHTICTVTTSNCKSLFLHFPVF